MSDAKPTGELPLVSFVVPTLNRGRYVLRAVESCLRNVGNGADVEVIVVDSSSDDGSFEQLQTKFGDDERVKLFQNPRGSGPVKSWIEGVEAASGNYMTFVWSDDLISPNFLRTLLPPLQAGAVLSYGEGKVVNVDSEMDFPGTVVEPEFIDANILLDGYYSLDRTKSTPDAVSPVCSLFDARLVRQWAHQVREFCRATPIRERVMWRHAVGPDLMLYLYALMPGRPPAAVFRTYTAQYSEHPGSITVSSGRSILRAGYWLARCWLLQIIFADHSDGKHRIERMWGILFKKGLIFFLKAPRSSESRRYFFGLAAELYFLLVMAWRGGFIAAGLRNAVLK